MVLSYNYYLSRTYLKVVTCVHVLSIYPLSCGGIIVLEYLGQEYREGGTFWRLIGDLNADDGELVVRYGC